MHFHLLDPQSLKSGSNRQKEAVQLLERLNLFDTLKDFSPVLTGALPLGIEGATSPLSIACSAPDLEAFANFLRTHFANYADFEVHHKLRAGIPCVVARLTCDEFIVEIFCQNQSVFQQHPVLLTLIEARLLTFSHPMAKEKIRGLVETGRTVEEAFAETFVLEGDASAELLNLVRELDRDILQVAHNFIWNADLAELDKKKN